LSADEKSKIEADIETLKEVCKGDDKDDIQKKTQNLAESSMKIGEMMYKDMQANQASPEDANNKDGVVDGEYKDLGK
jgi:molecular chaperone DnaK